MLNTYVYFHICTIENWEQIVQKLFDKLQRSGLLGICTELRVVVLGDQLSRAKEILNHPKTSIIIHSTDMSLYERPCLEHLRATAETEDCNVFYFHSKGIQQKNRNRRVNIGDWIDMMCYFLVDGHQRCIKLLTDAVAIGVNCIRVSPTVLKDYSSLRTPSNSWHFSGNFWWSCSQYIKTLPHKIAAGYIEPELWIGSGTGALLSLHDSNCWHYYNRYMPDKYVGKQTCRRVAVSNPLPTKLAIKASPIKKPIMVVSSVKKNYIYFHICTIGRWRQVVNRIYSLMKSGGLLDTVQQVYVSVLGNELEAVKKLLDHPKVVICFSSPNKALYERPCLLKLREHAERETFNVLYLHSKGITPGRQTAQVNDWIEYMCYYLVTQHQRCIELLADNHTVGVNLQRSGPVIKQGRASRHAYAETAFHYSGNFWWARSDHIKRLPQHIGQSYLDPEFWLGATTGSKMVSRWQSNIDHYRSRYPASSYVDKEKVTVQEI